MNSHVGYVVCSFSTTIESPAAELPTPMIGAPVPVKLVADWLDMPLELELPLVPGEPATVPLDPVLLDPNELDPAELDPRPPDIPDPPEPVVPELPKALPLDPELPLTVDGPPPMPEFIPLTLPSPGLATPANGCPKNPLTVVFCSPR